MELRREATYLWATMYPMSHLTPSMYRSMELRSEATYLWAAMYPMSQLTPSMYRSMELRSEATYLWAAMSHLTPSALDVILNPSGGIRILNNRISRLFFNNHMLNICHFLQVFLFSLLILNLLPTKQKQIHKGLRRKKFDVDRY